MSWGDLLSFIDILFYILTLLIVVRITLSYIMDPRSGVYQLIRRLTDPLINPFRPIGDYLIRRWGLYIDLSPLFAMIALNLLSFCLIGLISILL